MCTHQHAPIFVSYAYHKKTHPYLCHICTLLCTNPYLFAYHTSFCMTHTPISVSYCVRTRSCVIWAHGYIHTYTYATCAHANTNNIHAHYCFKCSHTHIHTHSCVRYPHANTHYLHTLLTPMIECVFAPLDDNGKFEDKEISVR